MSLADWEYHKLITITNSNSTALIDYQIKIKLDNSNFDFSKANSDGSDIRFSEDGVNTIPYWIENWDNSGQTATIWVKVSKINANSNKAIRMYYGNSSATSESNGDNTFIFFDDFSDSSLDLTNKWQTAGTFDTLEIVNGELHVVASNGDALLFSQEVLEKNIIIEDRGRLINREYSQTYFVQDIDNRYISTYYYASGWNQGIVKKVSGTETALASSNNTLAYDTYYRRRTMIKDSEIIYDLFNDNGLSILSLNTTDLAFSQGDVGFRTYGSSNFASEFYSDWLYVRQYADIEPIVNITPLINWKYYEKITIDHTKIDEDLTDFPILVKLDSTNFDFSKAQSSGNDIRFTSKDGTLLSYERERHDSTNQVAEYWVKISSVSSTTDTIFYIYYGNSSASDGADPTNVWDSNYVGVWHLNQDPSGTAPQELDSTLNNNDGTSNGSMTSSDLVEGQVDGALDFDGGDDYITMGDWLTDVNSAGKITFEFFEKSTSTADQTIWSTNNLTAANTLLISLSNVQYWDNNSTDNQILANSNYSDGNFHYFAVIINTTTNILNYYEDGILLLSKSFAAGSSIVNSSDMSLGRRSGGNYYTNAVLDEIRISNIARSASWIKASYNSENDTLMSYGEERANVNALFLGTNF